LVDVQDADWPINVAPHLSETVLFEATPLMFRVPLLGALAVTAATPFVYIGVLTMVEAATVLALAVSVLMS